MRGKVILPAVLGLALMLSACSPTPRSSGGSSNPPLSTSGLGPSAMGAAPRQSAPNGNAPASPPVAGSAPTAMASPTAGSQSEGKKLYATRCVACHKADGSGGVKLAGNATPNWADSNLMLLPAHSDSAMRDCIINGKPKSGMVAWVKSGQLKTAQVEDLIAYIRTFSRKK
jgi:mono/diheme cytochrome c family protein